MQLRPDQDGIQPMLSLWDKVIANCDLQDLARTLTVATQRGIRIRRART
jgi:hypothetical protein